MIIRQQWILAALFLVLASSGCTPTAEGPQDEQRNPFFLAGRERLQAMDYQGAAESFERALQDNPRSVLAHFELGVLYDEHIADYAAALYHYNKALKLRPAGYPADTIRNRIPACRQELVKADSLAVINPSVLRETERLREENQELKRQIVELKAALAAQPVRQPFPANGSSQAAAGTRTSTNTLSSTSSPGGSPARSPQGGTPGRTTTPESTEKVRYHTIRPGETLASLSRTYNVRLDALQAANRGIDPKRLKVGQTVKVPLR